MNDFPNSLIDPPAPPNENPSSLLVKPDVARPGIPKEMILARAEMLNGKKRKLREDDDDRSVSTAPEEE